MKTLFLMQVLPVKKKACHQSYPGLIWAIKHLGSNTLSFEIRINNSCGGLGLPLMYHDDLEGGLPAVPNVCELRCLDFEARFGSFLEQIITQTSCLEALRFLESNWSLAACAGRLQCLKHLEMDARSFVQGG